MSIKSIGMLSSAAVASLLLAACGGGGGGGDPSTGNSGPTPTPTPTNTAPVPNAGPAPTVAMPTDTITLTGTATDDGLPTGSTLAYTWELVTAPASPTGGPGAIIATPSAATTSVRLTGGAGAYVFNFKATDGALTGTSTLNVTLGANTNTYPVAIAPSVNGWTTALPADEGMTAANLTTAETYSHSTGAQMTSGHQPRTDAGYIIRHGKLVYKWGDETKLYEMKSTTKSMGGLALLLALDDGKVALTDKAQSRLPPNVLGTDPPVTVGASVTGTLADVTVLQLATHTAGFSKSDLKGAARTLDYTPGSTWSYSDQGLNWLADVLTNTYSRDLSPLMFERVYNGLGIRPTSDLVWRDNTGSRPSPDQNGTSPGIINGLARRELAAGINANVNAMARVGLLMLRQGAWNNTQMLSNAVVAKAHTPPPEVASATIADPTNYPAATTNYGMLWWTNANGAINAPKDTYWAWGLHETFIIVIPSKDIVIARAADAGWHADPEAWNADYSILAPFLEAIAGSVPP